MSGSIQIGELLIPMAFIGGLIWFVSIGTIVWNTQMILLVLIIFAIMFFGRK